MANKSLRNVQHFSDKGNANQNGFEIPSHLSQNAYHQGNKQQMLAWMQEKGFLYSMFVGM
jgi:hypothetical protein